MFAEILINTRAKELNKVYDYIVPKSLEKNIEIGARVFIPFGNRKTSEGFVIALKEKSEFAKKEIISIEDKLLTKENIELANIMSRRYFCNVSECINIMLPPGDKNKNINKRIKAKTGNFVYLKKSIEDIENDIKNKTIKSEKQIRLLEFLKKNEGSYIADLEAIAEVSKSVMKTLEKNGYISILEKKVERNPFINKNILRDKPLKLTSQQLEAFNKIKDSKYRQFLIYGVTGSRKDRGVFTINRKYYKK